MVHIINNMKIFINKINDFFSNFEALASLFLRFGIAIAFLIYGLNKFPLPPQGLIEYFDLSPALASFVAITEVSVGAALIIGGFIKNPYGNFITRIASFTIVILMINIFVIAHSDWFINTKLFTSVQIFLFIGGLYFLIKGNRS